MEISGDPAGTGKQRSGKRLDCEIYGPAEPSATAAASYAPLREPAAGTRFWRNAFASPETALPSRENTATGLGLSGFGVLSTAQQWFFDLHANSAPILPAKPFGAEIPTSFQASAQ